MLKDESIMIVLNSILDENFGVARIDTVLATISQVFSDLKITYNDVVSVGDRCMCLVYDDDIQSIIAV